MASVMDQVRSSLRETRRRLLAKAIGGNKGDRIAYVTERRKAWHIRRLVIFGSSAIDHDYELRLMMHWFRRLERLAR